MGEYYIPLPLHETQYTSLGLLVGDIKGTSLISKEWPEGKHIQTCSTHTNVHTYVHVQHVCTETACVCPLTWDGASSLLRGKTMEQVSMR